MQKYKRYKITIPIQIDLVNNQLSPSQTEISFEVRGTSIDDVKDIVSVALTQAAAAISNIKHV